MPEAAGPETALTPQRDPTLDLLRSLAIARVVLWHTFAATWLTYFAAMPVLFFIAGVLLATSDERRARHRVLLRRLRRLLPPVWLYGAVVILGGATHAYLGHDIRSTTTATAGDVVSWLVPVVDPRSSALSREWLTTHLWYIRAYVWILALTPLLVRFARHLRLALPALGVAVVALEMTARLGGPVAGSSGHVMIGDAVTYGTFAVLGMAYHFRRPRLRPHALLGGALLLALCAVSYVRHVGLPTGGVNDSYPLTLLTGLAWLFLVGAVEPSLRRLAGLDLLRRITLAVNRRAVTIYLWHPAAIVIAYAFTDRLRLMERMRPLAGVTVAATAVALTALAVRLAGWVEDLAADRRRPRLRRGTRSWRTVTAPVVTAIAMITTVVALPLVPEPRALASRSAGSTRPPLPPPSYRPSLTDASFARRAPGTGWGKLRLPGGVSGQALQVTLDQWLAAQPDVGSIAVAIDTGKQTWAGDARRPGTTSPTVAGDSYGVASVTKTFTLALTLQAAHQGRLELDAPVPVLPGIAMPADAARITPRQLLQHTSGLVDYPAAAGYDPTVPLTPADAVRLSLGTPLRSAPGKVVDYSNSNYQYLGLLLEHVNRRPYAAQIADLARAVGLRHTRVDPSTGPGWTGFASGGVHSTVIDLARWGTALFTPGRLLQARVTSELTALGPHNTGLGTWPLCPCSTDEHHQKRYTAIGQYTGHGGLYHVPDGFTVAIHIEPPIDTADARASSLIEAMRTTLRTSGASSISRP